jgi:lysophospholipase L1-like esterase
MKKKIIVLYLILIHGIFGVVLWKSDFLPKLVTRLGLRTIPELTGHYYHMVTYHKGIDPGVPEGATIFIGDSLTQALCVDAITIPAINYGIGNDTTVGVLERIPVYQSLDRANQIVLAIGINDMRYRENDAILENYHKIIDLLPQDVPLLISGLLPISKEANFGTTHNRISELNRKLAKLVKFRENITFIDPGSALCNSEGHLKDDFHRGDGVHLNPRGNAVWIQTLKSALKNQSIQPQKQKK